MAAWNSFSYIYVPGISTLSSLLCIVAQPPLSFLCCPRRPSHHPSRLTLVYLVPAFHLLPPWIPFWPFSTQPFFLHAQTISILWSTLLTNSLSIPALLPTSSFLTLSICDTSTKFLKHFISRTFSFLLSTLLILLPTFTLNFFLSHTLLNSLTSLHNFSSEKPLVLYHLQITVGLS